MSQAEITAEIRFWWPSTVPAELKEWYGQFDSREEERTDIYALAGPGIGMKQRGSGGPIELKLLAKKDVELPHLSFPGQLWIKRSAEGIQLSKGCHVHIRKRRRLSFFDDSGQPCAQTTKGAHRHCEAELGTVTIGDKSWGTFCLEASASFHDAPSVLASVWKKISPPDSVLEGTKLSYPELLHQLF